MLCFQAAKAQFISGVRYVSLKDKADFMALCNDLKLRETLTINFILFSRIIVKGWRRPLTFC